MPDIYAASDISLVTQAAGTGFFGLPSKIYRIMACGRPVVGICDASSEVATLITTADCGAVVAPHDPEALAATIKKACRDRLSWNDKGARGRQFVIEQFSVRRIADQYTDLLGRAAARR